MTHNVYAYILVMAVTSFFVRSLPILLMKRPIKNVFIQSFLYYVPYVTLAIMTFPAMVYATQNPLSGLIALICGIIVAWLGGNLFTVAVSCCTIVFIVEYLIP